MVQRSITSKLNFQLEDDDDDQKKNMLITTTRNNKVLRRPSSPRHHDAKNRGSHSPAAADLKIKKKKSRSLKTPPDFINITTPFARQPPPTPKKMQQQTPNYMKSTTSFDAKKEIMITSPQPQVSVKDSPITKISNSRHGPKTSLTKSSSLKILRKTISFKASRTSLKKSPPVLLDVKRATCSSTLKDSKFPTFLELNPAGTKICPYTYCSLNGHHHNHNHFPPLKRFISSMRQMLKTTKPTDACLSLPPEEEEEKQEQEKVDLFVDYMYVKKKVNGNDQESIDLDILSIDIESKYSEGALEEAPDLVSSEIDKLDENLGDGYSIDHDDWNGQGKPEDEIPIMGLDYPIDDLNEKTEEDGETPIIDDLNGQLEDEIPRVDLDGLGENMALLDDIGASTEVEDIHAKYKKKLDYEMKIVKSNNRGIGESEEHIGFNFNPKQPNYLEIEAEAEAEKVDLKHQEVEEKKNCKEWMLDYAIQQAVNKMSPAATGRKRRVSLLVEAFEKVMIPMAIPKYFGKSHSSKVAVFATPHSRPIQACS